MLGKTKLLQPPKLGTNTPSYVPTRREIAKACAQIRKTWDAATEKSRRAYINLCLAMEITDYPVFTKEGRKIRGKRRLIDCNLCDSEYWQYAIGDQWK